MDCTEFLDRYSDYDDSLLPSGETAAFWRHMDACPSCARYDRVLRKGRMVARQVEPPEPEGDFVPRLEQRLWVEASPRSPRSPALAAGFLTLTLTAALGLWRAPGPGPGTALASGTVHFHDDTPTDRPLVLPPTAYADPSERTDSRVDRRVAPSYSPLVTGPPAYRGDRAAFPSTPTAPRHTLD